MLPVNEYDDVLYKLYLCIAISELQIGDFREASEDQKMRFEHFSMV